MTKVTVAEFISRSREHFGDFYDYSNVLFNTTRDKVRIICPSHGEFQTYARDHMRGVRCKKCHSDSIRVSVEEFLSRAKNTHGDLYAYDKDSFSDGKIDVYCSIHGKFRQWCYNHVIGNGCQKCHIDTLRLSAAEVSGKISEKHADQYELIPTSYTTTDKKIEAICKDHGDQSAFVFNLLAGRKLECCSKLLRISQLEKEVFNFIRTLTQNVAQSDRKLLNGEEIDIYCPLEKIGIEVNGNYWHSDTLSFHMKGVNAKTRHSNKKDLAQENGVRLFYVWENDWHERRSEIQKALIELFDTGKASPVLERLC